MTDDIYRYHHMRWIEHTGTLISSVLYKTMQFVAIGRYRVLRIFGRPDNVLLLL